MRSAFFQSSHSHTPFFAILPFDLQTPILLSFSTFPSLNLFVPIFRSDQRLPNGPTCDSKTSQPGSPGILSGTGFVVVLLLVFLFICFIPLPLSSPSSSPTRPSLPPELKYDYVPRPIDIGTIPLNEEDYGKLFRLANSLFPKVDRPDVETVDDNLNVLTQVLLAIGGGSFEGVKAVLREAFPRKEERGWAQQRAWAEQHASAFVDRLKTHPFLVEFHGILDADAPSNVRSLFDATVQFYGIPIFVCAVLYVGLERG